MKLLRRLAFFPPFLLGIALLWWAGQNREAPTSVTPEERRTLAAYIPAKPRAFTPEVSGYGQVAPARVWTALAQVAGRVTFVHKDFVRGGTVSEGDVLFEIARDTYELAVARAEADVRSAEAKVDEIRLSEDTTKAALAIEQQALKLLENDLARVTKLNQSGTTTSASREAKQREVLAQRSKVQSVETTLTLLPAQLQSAQQNVVVARTAKQSAELDLDRTVVTAPFDGRVTRADVEVSQFVGVGGAMGSIDGVAIAEIDVQMPPQLMAALAGLAFDGGQLGDINTLIKAEVSIDGGGSTAKWPAQVARISDVVDPETRSIGVIVQVTDPYGGVEPGERPPLIKGMLVKVTLASPQLDQVILVPRSTIRNGQLRIAGPDDRLAYAPVSPIFSADGLSVLAPNALPEDARIVTSDLSPAIKGMLLAPERDVFTETRLDTVTSPQP